MASAMFILKTGRLRRSIKGSTVGFINEGEFFEEYATLKKNCQRKESVTAEIDSEVIALGVEEIERALGKSLPIIILRNKAK